MQKVSSTLFRSLFRAETAAREAASRAMTDEEYRKHIGRAERCLRLQHRIQRRIEERRQEAKWNS